MKHKRRSIWVVITIVLASLVICGALVYSAAHKHTNSPKGISGKTDRSSNHPFVAESNSNQPLIVTTSSVITNRTITSTVQSDGIGNYLYTYDLGGKPMHTVYTPDAFYQCKGADQACVKYPNDPSISNFDPGGYAFSPEKIKELKNTAKYSGQQRCPGGNSTCDVWYAISKYNTSTYYYVDTASKQIVQTIHYGRFGEGKSATKVTVKNTYTYQHVHVTVPTDYTDAPKSK